MQAHAKGKRLSGAERVELADHLATEYYNGRSIRQLAGSSGHSYGLVHRLLSQSGSSCAAAAQRYAVHRVSLADWARLALPR